MTLSLYVLDLSRVFHDHPHIINTDQLQFSEELSRKREAYQEGVEEEHPPSQDSRHILTAIMVFGKLYMNEVICPQTIQIPSGMLSLDAC